MIILYYFVTVLPFVRVALEVLWTGMIPSK